MRQNSKAQNVTKIKCDKTKKTQKATTQKLKCNKTKKNSKCDNSKPKM